MMSAKWKILTLFFFVFLFSNQVSASHFTGGEITWECLPSGQYRFTFTLYRDCSGANAPNGPIALVNNAGATISCVKISTTYLNPECGAVPCGSIANGVVGAMERHVYRSGPITLSGSPPATGWVFSWTDCCRPNTGNLVGQDSYYLHAIMYPYTPPGSGAPLVAFPCYDNSPNFLEAPLVTVCTNKPSEYQSIGYDLDLDSLYYDWAPAKDAANTNVPYKPGYSPTSPLPSTNGSIPAVLDNQIGRMTFQSNIVGQYAVATSIKEYRCGQLIGEIKRDLVIVTKTCTPATGICGGNPNNAPSLGFQWTPGFDTLTKVYNSSGVLTHYEMEVYAGTEVDFTLVSFDTDLSANCLSDRISFVGQGGNLSPAPNYNNANNCLFQAPCATMAPAAGQSSFSNQVLANRVKFNWQTTCDHLTYQPYSCGGLKNTYDYFFRFEDNSCPYAAFSYATVKITVVNSPPLPPDLSTSCISIQPNGSIIFDYIPQDTGRINFDYYTVYRSNNGAPFAAIDSIPNYATTSFTDATPPAGTNRYFMRAYGGCSLVSGPSDTIQSITLNLVAVPPPPNSSIAMLTWNARKPSGPAGEMYQVWREICGTNNWEQIATTPTLAYNDTVNVCGECLRYQIRINGACFSTTDSGYFADQSNTDIINIDSVSVIGGFATMVWDTTNTSSDVTDYIVLKRDITGSWIQVAAVPIGSPFPYVYSGSLANSESERFKVVTIDSCGNQSSDLNATSHGTIYLSVNSDPCEGFVRLRWNTYRTWNQSAVATYNLYADITPPGGPTQNRVLVYQGGPNDSSYIHLNVTSGSQYCYYVQVTDTTGLYHSTSNRQCIEALVVKKSRLLYLGHATVKDNESVEIYGFIDRDADVIDYGIERADNVKGPFMVLGRIPKPTTGPWVVKFIDYGASFTTNRYYYRISAQDSCGAVDTISNFGRNILLQVNANGNLTNTLIWNPYEQWDGIVGKYEVYRQVDNNGAWTLVSDQLTEADTTFIDDIRSFGNTKGAFCYYIKAVETGNSLGFVNEFGLPFNSVSNLACVTHNARVFVPNAFNPKSSVLENRVWKPTNIFARANSYEMFIMNRWGEKVFQTTNLEEGWDGTYKGQDSPLGVYTYYINYRSLEGVPIEERGTFTLFRNE